MPIKTSSQYLEAILNLPGLAGARVSPNGRWAAWTWFRMGPAADVYAAPADGSAAPIRLTDTTDDTMVVSWTSDSKGLLVEQDRNGDERVSLYRVDLDSPGEMRRLTELSPPYFLRGGQLHPNGKWLVYGANWDSTLRQEIQPTWVYRQDLETGERLILARPAKPHWYAPELNEQGTYILYTRSDLHPAGQQACMVDIEGRKEREILNFGPDVKVFPSWFPDGRRVIFTAEAGTYRRVGIWDRESGESEWILDNPARNIERVYVPHGSSRVVIIEVEKARTRASLLDPKTGQEERLPEVAGSLTPLAPVADGAGPASTTVPGSLRTWFASPFPTPGPRD